MLWNWQLEWRREFFEWELQSFNELISLLNQKVFLSDVADRSVWMHHSSGRFSVKSLLSLMPTFDLLSSDIYSTIRKVWRGLAPPKAELLRLNTRDQLARFNVIRAGNENCVLCN